MNSDSLFPYSDNELLICYKGHLQNIDDSGLVIKKLGFYAACNHTKYDIFIQAIQECFDENVKALPKQIAYIYLVNEIVQKETPDNVKLFMPLIEKMMVKAAETRDQEHISKAKRVLSILDERNILESKFVQRVITLMDFNAKSGEDEDSIIVNQFYSLIDKLIQAKNISQKLIINKKSDEEIDAALTKEKQIRTEITDFYTKQINSQYAQIEQIDKQLDAKKKNELDHLISGSDTSSSSDELL